MDILVGILYSGENEFQECLASIKNQTLKHKELFVVENMPNKQAHDYLYEKFMEESARFDLFVKIDADMVLANNELFEKIAHKFENNKLLKNIEIAVHDFFSDQLIWGMHAYRNGVRWIVSDDELMVDYVYEKPFQDGERMRDDVELAPAAYHCKNPTLFQSFHYGVHKALKVIQPDRKKAMPQWSDYHFQLIKKIEENYIRTLDTRVGMAVLGAHIGFKRKFPVSAINYTSKDLSNFFSDIADLDEKQLNRKILGLSRKNLGYFPDDVQKQLLIKLSRPGSIFTKMHQLV